MHSILASYVTNGLKQRDLLGVKRSALTSASCPFCENENEKFNGLMCVYSKNTTEYRTAAHDRQE